MMLIGILFSEGYSRVVSLNTSGLRLFKESDEQMDRENVLLWLNQPRDMEQFTLVYKGARKEVMGFGELVSYYELSPTEDEHAYVLKSDLREDNETVYAAGDTVQVNEENTYFEVEYYRDDELAFTLYPRAQVNPSMGLIARYKALPGPRPLYPCECHSRS